jgi:kumamolisin
MDSLLGGRLGFLNPALYQLAGKSGAYSETTSPFNDITSGDNWNFIAAEGYDDGSGIGSPNVTNLESALSANFLPAPPSQS